jgi:hypothetical protein
MYLIPVNRLKHEGFEHDWKGDILGRAPLAIIGDGDSSFHELFIVTGFYEKFLEHLSACRL